MNNELSDGAMSVINRRWNEAVLSRWKSTGLLEGLEDEYARKMAVLLENTEQWLLSLDDEELVKNVSSTIFSAVIEAFQGIDFDVVSMPVYMHNDGVPRTTAVQGTSIVIDTAVGKEEENKEIGSLLKRYLQDKIDDKCDIVVYTPITFDQSNNLDKKEILFRGNFIR